MTKLLKDLPAARKASAEAQAKVKAENSGFMPIALTNGFRERMEAALSSPRYIAPSGMSPEDMQLFIIGKAQGAQL